MRPWRLEVLVYCTAEQNVNGNLARAAQRAMDGVLRCSLGWMTSPMKHLCPPQRQDDAVDADGAQNGAVH